MSKHFSKIRERLGMSQLEMAASAGVSIPLISRLESGRIQWGNLQSRTRRGLALAYNVSPMTGEPVPAQAQEPAPASSQNAA